MLFITVCKNTPCLSSNTSMAKKYRNALLKEFPEGCPLLPPGLEQFVQVYCKPLVHDSIKYILKWPKSEMLGAFSIGATSGDEL